MPISFWIKRLLLALSITFIIICLVQWLKSQSLEYALLQAVIWAPITTLIYLVVLWRKLDKNKTCALNCNQSPDT